jgi:Flp pilus assembly protein TadG
MAVEFSIVALIFFAIVLGLIELSRALMVKHLLTNAARQGCRAGIVEGSGTSDVSNAVNAVLAAQGISGDSVTVTVNDGSGNMSSIMAGDEVTVKVTVPASAIMWLPGMNYVTGTLGGQYTLRRE